MGGTNELRHDSLGSWCLHRNACNPLGLNFYSV